MVLKCTNHYKTLHFITKRYIVVSIILSQPDIRKNTVKVLLSYRKSTFFVLRPLAVLVKIICPHQLSARSKMPYNVFFVIISKTIIKHLNQYFFYVARCSKTEPIWSSLLPGRYLIQFLHHEFQQYVLQLQVPTRFLR